MPTNTTQLLTLEEVSAIIRRPVWSVRKLRRQGAFPSVDVSDSPRPQWRVRQEDLDAWIKRNEAD